MLSGQFVNKGSHDQNITWDFLRIIPKYRFQTSEFNSGGLMPLFSLFWFVWKKTINSTRPECPHKVSAIAQM